MSSLEEQQVEAFAPGLLPAHLGMTMKRCGDGSAVVCLPFREVHRQHLGVLQGGVTATLIDVAMAWAVSSLIHPRSAPTIDLNVQYLRPVVDEDLECEATVIRAGRSVATARAEVTTNTGALVAVGTGTFLVRPSW
ncbi:MULTISPECIES: PaaI family thioesterase [unclassified Micromonospora]|uniref:PaaI family thioesterase n=1 Tax=unclassified Micromonospora TaxID=2617518 RepID=UPI0033A814FC